MLQAYLGSPLFECRQGYRLSWSTFRWLLSVSVGKYMDSPTITPRPLPSKSFPVTHQSSYHCALYSVRYWQLFSLRRLQRLLSSEMWRRLVWYVVAVISDRLPWSKRENVSPKHRWLHTCTYQTVSHLRRHWVIFSFATVHWYLLWMYICTATKNALFESTSITLEYSFLLLNLLNLCSSVRETRGKVGWAVV
jgi:hypothetical protein